MTDPVFNKLTPKTLGEIAGILGSNAELDWLDDNRQELEDEVRSAGSWTFGETRTYEGVVRGLAEKINVKIAGAVGMREVESELIKHLWRATEKNLSSAQREELHRKVEEEARKHGKSMGPAWAAGGVLAAAQLSGFGVYILGSTVLGALNGALGLGLSFGAFTGLSSAISIMIGPIGWFAVGALAIVKLTAPNYKKILPIAILVAIHREEIVAEEIEGARLLLQQCKEWIRSGAQRAYEEVERRLEASTRTETAIVRDNLDRLELTENRLSVLRRIRPDDARMRHESEVLLGIRGAVEAANTECRRLESVVLSLPILDASTNSGMGSISVRAPASLSNPRFERPDFPLQVCLNRIMFKHVLLWLKERIWGRFSMRARVDGSAQRGRLERQRGEDVIRQYEIAWQRYNDAVLAECGRVISSVFQELSGAVHDAELALARFAE